MSESEVDRLLPGERPDSHDAQDAERWIQIYSQMIAVKYELMAKLDGHLPALEELARNELEETDMSMMRQQVARFERRLAFWKRRLEQQSEGETAQR